MNTDKDKNEATGHKQSDFAGTNADRYGPPSDNQDNPVNPEEAQNVAYDGQRLEGEEAEKAANKATEGIKQNRDK